MRTNMNNAIGGFFELETCLSATSGKPFHSEGLFLSNGRASMRLLLKQLKPFKIYIPYYTCDALLIPLIAEQVPFEYYSINERFEAQLPEMEEGEYFLYINFWGLKNGYIKDLASILGEKLIIDNTQAFFYKNGSGVKYHFNTCRKFFGVPDGSYLFGLSSSCLEEYPANKSIQFLHLTKRLKGSQQEAYGFFLKYESGLPDEVLKGSGYTAAILDYIDYTSVMQQRRENYLFYQRELGSINTIDNKAFDALEDQIDAIPFGYPFFPHKSIDKRQLFSDQIFIPTFWPEVLERNHQEYSIDIEQEFAERLLILPVDHRYTPEKLYKIVAVLKGML